MADIIKAATRDGYGKALVELGAINDKLVVLDADLAEATKQLCSKRRIRTDSLIPALPSAT